MFRRQPPPSKRKSTPTNQNSTVVNCLSYRARKSDSLRVLINTERSKQVFLLCMMRWFTITVLWFVELDVLNDGGGRHRDMLEYSLALCELLKFVICVYCLKNF